MVKCTKDNGKETKCMGKAFLYGAMEKNMRDTSKTTNEKGEEFLSGGTVASTMECGRMENSTV